MKAKFIHIQRQDVWWLPETLQEMIDDALATRQIKRYGSKAGHVNGRSAVLRYPNAVTICDLTDDDGRRVRGYAFCSARDNFCKARGRKISRGRAEWLMYKHTYNVADSVYREWKGE